jgi:CBS domain-containing protein
MLVTDVMSRRPISITSDWRIKQAARLAAEEEVSSLPVVDRRGQICGIVSDADLIRDAFTPSPTLLVSEVMSSPAITVRETTGLAEVVELMTSRGIKSLPVVDDAGRVLGMISRSDVVRASVLEVGGGHVEVAVPGVDRSREVVADRRHQAELGT